MAARTIEEQCRKGIELEKDKHTRGALRKGAYYLARIVYLVKSAEFTTLIEETIAQPRKVEAARRLVGNIQTSTAAAYPSACEHFQKTLRQYLKANGTNEDAALKNSAFALLVDKNLTPPSITAP